MNPPDKYREALELIEKHLGESMTCEDIAKVIAYQIMQLAERLETGRTPK